MCERERESYDTKKGSSFYVFWKTRQFFLPKWFSSSFCVRVTKKKVIKAKVKDLNEPYVRTTLILTTFL